MNLALLLPADATLPNPDYLEWHRQHIAAA
jgi:hypothetical protein